MRTLYRCGNRFLGFIYILDTTTVLVKIVLLHSIRSTHSLRRDSFINNSTLGSRHILN